MVSAGHEERCINKEPAVRQVLVKLLDKPVILNQTESVAWSQASDMTVMNVFVSAVDRRLLSKSLNIVRLPLF